MREHELIKGLLKWWKNEVFSWINLWILDDTESWKWIKKWIKELKETFSIKKWKNILKAYEVWTKIDKLASNVIELLQNNWFWLPNVWKWKKTNNLQVVDEISQIVSYRAFIYWVLELLELEWFDTEKFKKSLSDVPDNLWMIIYDILKDQVLTTFLIVLKSYWLIDLSDNEINNFEIEEELKILNIDKDSIILKLEEVFAKKVFEWEIEDVYYDYPWQDDTLASMGWVKSTFRIRRRSLINWETKYYYTIKRKLSDEEEKRLISENILQEMQIVTRRCYEKELEIKDFSLFERIIKSYWLVEVRRKKKLRVSYSLHWIKFDFDKYGWYNQMLEIEAKDNTIIPYWLRELWIEDEKQYPRMATGSRLFFENDLAREKKLIK